MIWFAIVVSFLFGYLLAYWQWRHRHSLDVWSIDSGKLGRELRDKNVD